MQGPHRHSFTPHPGLSLPRPTLLFLSPRLLSSSLKSSPILSTPFLTSNSSFSSPLTLAILLSFSLLPLHHPFRWRGSAITHFSPSNFVNIVVCGFLELLNSDYLRWLPCHFNQERPGMSEGCLLQNVKLECVWSLDPTGNYRSTGACPNMRRRIPHGVQTLVAVAAADNQRIEERRQGTGWRRVAHLIA